MRVIDAIGGRKVVKADGGDVRGGDLVGGEGSGGDGVRVVGELVLVMLGGEGETQPVD